MIKIFCGKLSVKWNESETGWLFTRDLCDYKIKNSFIYKVINAPFSYLSTRVFDGKTADLIKNSAILNLFSKYKYGVYGIVLLSPFIPTMACVAIVLLTLISFIINKIITGGKTGELDAFTFLVIMLMGVFAFFGITSLTPVSSIKILLVYLPFMAFLFLVISAVKTEKELYRLLTMFVTSGAFVSLYGIYQQFFGSNEGHAWLDNDMFSDIGVRVYSTFGNPNVLGEYLLLLIPIAFAMFWKTKNIWGKLYFLGISGLSAVCMIFTQSRGCWLGLILVAAVYIILVDKRYILLGVLAVMALPFVMPKSIIERFTSIGNLGDSSTSYRVYIWYGTLNLLKAFGLEGLGLGTDAFNMIYPIYSYKEIIAPHAHNIYLVLLCESGWLGLLLFVVTMFIGMKKLYTGYNADRKGFSGVICAAVLAGLFGILLQGFFDYIWYNYRVFLIFWMVIGFGISARRVSYDKAVSCNK